MKTFYRIAKTLILAGLFAISYPLFAAETLTYYHWDALGSPIAATDQQGNVVWREEYKPYGERIKNEAAAQANTRWYSGHPHDQATGLTYMGARYYDPAVGRFMGVDPNGFAETNPHSFNRYAYGNNNPYKYIDPDGRAAETVLDLISLGLSINEYRQDPSFWNGVGVAVDAIGTVIPFVPAGVGTIRQIGKASDISDATVVVRGGTKELPPPGEVFSGATGKTLEDAAAGVPHGQIRATTAGEIRAAGGTVVHKPELTRSGALNEKHADVCLGPGPCSFGPLQPNPVPKAERIE